MQLSTDIDTLGPWAYKLMGCGVFSPVGTTALGELNDDGSPRWAAVYENYEPGGSIQMHIAIDDPKYVSRRAICAAFEYPFYQLGVKKVLGFVDSRNESALTFDLRLGFEVEAVIEDAYDGGNMYILSMTRESCRWLRGKQDGQEG